MLKNRLNARYTFAIAIASLVTCSSTLPMHRLFGSKKQESTLPERTLQDISCEHQECLSRCQDKFKAGQNSNLQNHSSDSDYDTCKKTCDGSVMVDTTITSIAGLNRLWEMSDKSPPLIQQPTSLSVSYMDIMEKHQRCRWSCSKSIRNSSPDKLLPEFNECNNQCDANFGPEAASLIVGRWRRNWEAAAEKN